jgi:predicted HAD superfamily hydrolase
MSITEKLTSAVPSKAGKGCGMCSVLEQLNDEDRVAIISAMRVPITVQQRITDRQIADILQSEGYEISHNSVYRHRQNHLDKQ